MNLKIIKNVIKVVAILIILIPLYFILYKIYIPRVNAFGCFDDCFNFGAGFLILKGKILYSQIFFNHQMLMAYLSTLIQSFSNPVNIYELVLRHRQFVILFGLIFNFFIIFRFKFIGIGFVLIYEFSKFYIFGDRFLAEALIVYPLIYLSGLIYLKFCNKEIFSFEYILAAIFSWFVLFMREPFSLLAIFCLILILFGRKQVKMKPHRLTSMVSSPPSSVVLKSARRRQSLWRRSTEAEENIHLRSCDQSLLRRWIKIVSVLLFGFATLFLFLKIPLKDYLFNVFTVNSMTVLKSEQVTNNFLGQGLFKTFFYPIYIFFNGDWNLFRQLLVVLDIIFLSSFILYLYFYKNIKTAVVIFLLLGFANIRFVPPGNVFYAAFHMLPWFGIFIFTTFFLVNEVYRTKKIVGIILAFIPMLFLGYFLITPASYIREKIDTHKEFIDNYGNYLQTGEAIKALSNPKDALFVDGFDELIIWQSKRLSNYKYSWYTSVMPLIPLYSEERLKMFATNPPDFYYGSCPKDTNYFRLLPENLKNNYQQLNVWSKPSCLYVNKDKLPEITDTQWNKAKEFLYELPDN